MLVYMSFRHVSHNIKIVALESKVAGQLNQSYHQNQVAHLTVLDVLYNYRQSHLVLAINKTNIIEYPQIVRTILKYHYLGWNN